MEKINFANKLQDYLLNPLSKERSRLDRAICLIASAVLAVLTLGILHIGIALYNKWNRYVENHTHSPNASGRFVRDAISIILHPNEARDNSLKKEAWVEEVASLIGKGKYQYTEELGKDFEKLLQKIPNPNVKVPSWMNGHVLHQIAKHGYPINFVGISAKHNVDFNIQDGIGNTPLLWAVANGKNEMALEILEYNQNLDIQGLGNSALYLAIAKGYKNHTYHGHPLTVTNLQLVEKMAEKGANPNLKNRKGYTSLHLACIRRDFGMIKALLEAGGDPSIPFNGKNCLELLDMSFEEANEVMKSITPPYLLPESDFQSISNLESCKEKLLEHLVSS